MPIIIIAGCKGCGKDTLADEFVKYGWKKYSMADALKKSVQILFNLSNNQLWGDEKEVIDKRWGVSPRYLLQTIGTDVLRDELGKHLKMEIKIGTKLVKTSFHIKRLHEEIYSKLLSGEKIIIADGRFQDEINYVKLLGGKVLLLTRNVITNNYSVHKSETNLNKILGIDCIINNNGTKKDLFNQAKIFYN